MKIFKRIYIEITNCCNLSCSFCPPTKRNHEFMDFLSFEKILKKIKGHGYFVYLHIKGEPMLHPQFLEILELCAKYGLQVNLTTNGTLIHKYLNELIKSKALRQVSISLQSQEHMKDEVGFKDYMSWVMALIQKGREKSDIIFELRLWNYKGTLGGKEKDKNQIALAIIMKELNVFSETIEAIPRGKGIKLMEQVYLSKSVEFQWPNRTLEVIDEIGTCYGLRQQVGVLVNGDVVPCCLDGEGDMVLGNIFEKDFEAIITSKGAKHMVNNFENNRIVEPLCQRCGYRSKFSNKNKQIIRAKV